MGTLAMSGESVWGGADDREAMKTLQKAYEKGITLFDTAPAYGFGHSEELLGEAFKAHRPDIVISTKCGVVWNRAEGDVLYCRDGHTMRRNLTPESITEEIEASLKRLRTDYIDIYFIHWLATAAFPVPASDTMGKLEELKREGRIRAIGASNVTKEQLEEYLSYGRIDIVQNRFSMLDQKAFRGMNDFCRKNSITFQAYSPFERGILAGKAVSESIVQSGDARSGIKWYKGEYLGKITGMLREWKPLCEKYGCSQSALTVAWMLAQAENVNVDAGSRRAEAVEQNAAGAIIDIERSDLEMMNKKIADLLEECDDKL